MKAITREGVTEHPPKRPACHNCATTDNVIPGEISSGWPHHIWRYWCRPCLTAFRRDYQTNRP